MKGRNRCSKLRSGLNQRPGRGGPTGRARRVLARQRPMNRAEAERARVRRLRARENARKAARTTLARQESRRQRLRYERNRARQAGKQNLLLRIDWERHKGSAELSCEGAVLCGRHPVYEVFVRIQGVVRTTGRFACGEEICQVAIRGQHTSTYREEQFARTYGG